MDDVMERPTGVFRATFCDEALELRPEMTTDDVDARDAVSHITLIHAVQDEFGPRFSPRDLEAPGCVGDLAAAIARRA